MIKKMTRFDREALAKRIVSFYEKQDHNKKFLTYQHFHNEGIPKSTIYGIIAKYEKTGEYRDLPRSGRPPKMTKEKVKRLSKMVDNTSGIGQRHLANVFNVTQQTISYTLRRKTEIGHWKKEEVPAYEGNQEARAVTASRKMVTKTFYGKDIVMDDEKYFTLSNTDISGNDSYYSSNKALAPPHIKYKMKKKYEAKVLVWAAISINGISDVFIRRSGIAISADTYINECLRKRLLPFVREAHSDGNYVFWPDLASAHYAKKTQEWLRSKNIDFIEKVENAPNLPQGRPIEKFWAILSARVYKGGWQAKTTYQLIRRINRVIREIKENDPNLIQNLMSKVKTKLRKIADNGVYALNQ